jgi:uncharacterized RDD family membrane protein YckC
MTQPPLTGPDPLAAGPAPGMEFARALPRLIAYLVDGLITTLLMVVVAFALGTVVALAGSAGRDFIVGLGIILYFLAFLAIWLFYFPFFWGRGGQTPGARLMKIRVVSDEDGSPIGMGTGFIRLFGYFVSGLVFSVGFIWILIDLRRRGWHDLMAGTCVVKA